MQLPQGQWSFIYIKNSTCLSFHFRWSSDSKAADMENVNLFTLADFFQSKFLPGICKLGQNENCNKTANIANYTICISITTLIPLWYSEVNPFWPFLPPIFHNQFFLYHHNFTKNCTKLWPTAHLQQNSACSKPRFYPSSQILHEQRYQCSWHFSCL